MSAKEVNFTFNDLHCLRDFGCVFILSSGGRTVSPATQRNAYEIAGVSGSILLGEKATHAPYTLAGQLVPMVTPKSEAAAQQIARRVSAWLLSGRGVLIWDYEPFQSHIAEVTAATEWNTKVWMDGGLAFTFTVQPYTYDLAPTISRKELSAGVGTLAVPVSTVLPCPVSVSLTNKGSAAITAVKVSAPNGNTVGLGKGMKLLPGETLDINMEPPIGATISGGSATVNALRYALRFDPLELSGPGSLTITTDGKAAVVATARGLFL